MLSAIRNSPLAKRLFGEPQPPDTSAFTLTDVVSYSAAEGDDAMPDGHKTPPTQVPLRADDPSSSLPQDAVLDYEASRQAQDEPQGQMQQQQQLTQHMMQQQAATNDPLAQLTATAKHAMHNAAGDATRQQGNANPIATAAAAAVLNAAENATLQQGTAVNAEL